MYNKWTLTSCTAFCTNQLFKIFEKNPWIITFTEWLHSWEVISHFNSCMLLNIHVWLLHSLYIYILGMVRGFPLPSPPWEYTVFIIFLHCVHTADSSIYLLLNYLFNITCTSIGLFWLTLLCNFPLYMYIFPLSTGSLT